jgi:hypothetical protein
MKARMSSKLRKQPIAMYSPWNHCFEAGVRLYAKVDNRLAHIYDLRESTGRNKRDRGELTPRIVKKNGEPRIAYQREDGVWFWK